MSSGDLIAVTSVDGTEVFRVDSSGNLSTTGSVAATGAVSGATGTFTGTLTAPSLLVGADMWAATPGGASVLTHTFFDDFTADNIGASGWVVTEDDVACTQAIGDVLNGAMTLTCKATTDDNACQIIWAQETFRLTAGKRIWFETRLQSASGSVAQADWAIGLIEAEDLTGVADNMPANGVVFHKDDGAATYVLSSSDGGTNIQSGAAVGTIANATWVRLGFLFDGGASGSATITPYVDGVAGTAIASVTYATMAELAAFVMIRNGDATTTQSINVDYFKVVQER